MQMNPTELVVSRISFQSIEPGATRCARHSPTPFLAQGSPSPYCYGSAACSAAPLGRRDGIHAPHEALLLHFQIDVLRCWPRKALSASARRCGPNPGDPMIILGMFLLCYACCWSLLCLTFRYSLALPAILCFFEFRFAACAVQFRSLSWSIPPGLFLCHFFGHLFHSFLLYIVVLAVVIRSYHVEEHCPRPAGRSERRCNAVRYVH